MGCFGMKEEFVKNILKIYNMLIIRTDDSCFRFECRAYTLKQAKGYAKHIYGNKIMIRDIKNT